MAEQAMQMNWASPAIHCGVRGRTPLHSNRFNGFADACGKPLKRFRPMGAMRTPE
jgi:hypothetical protein